MAKKPFSIADYIAPEDVSKMDTPATESIVNIPIGRIVENSKNFYDTHNVDELVKSIELNGLIEPIIVKPTVSDPQIRNGAQFYEIISGHRRFKAYNILAKDDLKKWREIPAIVREPKSELLEELLLIEANRATRVLSSADIMKQAERYQELLAELKSTGVEIPGRMRDAVAEALNVSATKLARLKKIKENLIPGFMVDFEANKLNESIAYTLAQASRDAQAMVYGYCGAISKTTEWKVRDDLTQAQKIIDRACPQGGDCDRSDYIFIGNSKQCKQYSSVCCKGCWRYADCPVHCRKCAEEQKAEIENKRAENDVRAEAEAEKRRRREAENAKTSSRVSAALRGVTRESFNDAKRIVPLFFNCGSPCIWDAEDWDELVNDDELDIDRLDDEDLLALAIAADTSFEYLIGLIDDPASMCAEVSGHGWRDAKSDPPQPGFPVFVYCGNQNVSAHTYDVDKIDAKGNWDYNDDVRWWMDPPATPDNKEENDDVST